MANTYKSTALNLSTTGSFTLYTVPQNTTTLVKSCYCGNVYSTNVSVDIFIEKSGSSTDSYLISGALVPFQASFQPITEPIILQEEDSIKVSTTTSGSIDTLLSYVELT